jgi:hypothetical protein
MYCFTGYIRIQWNVDVPEYWHLYPDRLFHPVSLLTRDLSVPSQRTVGANFSGRTPELQQM